MDLKQEESTRLEHKSEISAYMLAIEGDLLNIVQEHLLHEFSEDHEWLYLGTEFRKAAIDKFYEEYSDEDHREHIEKSVECLNWAEPFFILMNHKNLLPSDIRKELENVKHDFNWLPDVRTRAHHRGKIMLENQYVDTLAFVHKTTNRNSDIWKDLDAVYNHSSREEKILYLQQHKKDLDEESSIVVNNLPIPPHSETGLIGRDKIIKQIKAKVLQWPIVSILGEGGVGKTALALEIAHQFKDDEGPFEQIFFCSLKTSALDRDGIRQLRDDLPDMNLMYKEIDKDTYGEGKDNLTEALELAPTLLIIDNLETIPAEDAIEEILNLSGISAEGSEHTKILITSRRGLMQLESPVPIKHLERKDGIKLFRNMLKVRQLNELAEKGQDYLGEIVDKLTAHPLTLWWVATCLEKGTSLDDIIKNKLTDVIEFCVGDSINSLDEFEQLILRMIGRLGTARILQLKSGLQIVDQDTDHEKIKLTLEKLKMMSLVEIKYKKSQLQEYSLISTVSKFLTINQPNADIANMLSAMMNAMIETPYSKVTKQGDGFVEPEYMEWATQEEFHFANQLKNIAKQTKAIIIEDRNQYISKFSAFRRQLDEIKNATNHGYFEVYRLSAFLESQVEKHSPRAERDYQKALALTNYSDMRVKFWYSSFLFFSNRFPEAKEHMQEVYEKHNEHPAVVRLFAENQFELKQIEHSIELLKTKMKNVDEEKYPGRTLPQLTTSFLNKAIKYPLLKEISPKKIPPVVLNRVIKEIKFVTDPKFKNRWDKSAIHKLAHNISSTLWFIGVIRESNDFDYSDLLVALRQFPGKFYDTDSYRLKRTAREFGLRDILDLLEEISPYTKTYFGTITYIYDHKKEGFISYRENKEDEGTQNVKFWTSCFKREEDLEKIKLRQMVKFTLSDYIPEPGDIKRVALAWAVEPRKK